MNEEWRNYNFGAFPWAKYMLYVNGHMVYSFVTTVRSEENCIEELKGIAESKNNETRVAFYIVKKTKTEQKTIYSNFKKR